METLIELDQQVFEWINGEWTWSILDQIMPWWRDKKTWYPLYIFIIIFSVVKFRLKGLYFILAVVLSIGLADLCSSQLLKKNVKRLRPCNDLEFKEEVRLLVHCGRAYSFTSSHAANHFAIATFISLTLGLMYGWIKWPLMLWAGSIAYGQVYVGVHYPLDILVGSLIGILVGFLIAKLYLRADKLKIDIQSNKLAGP